MDNSLVPFPPPRDGTESVPAVAGGGGPTAVAAYDPSIAYATPQAPQKKDPLAKLKRWWAAIKRFWWLILIFLTLGGAAGFMGTRFVSPTYEATGRLWITDANQGNNANPLRVPELLPTASWLELFRSFAVVDPVVDSLELWYAARVLTDGPALRGMRVANPGGEGVVGGAYTLAFSPSGEYTITEEEAGVVEQGVIGDSVTGVVGRNLGIHWMPSLSVLQSTGKNSIAFDVWLPRAVAVGLAEQVTLAMGDRANLLSVSITGSNKERTARLLNVWMDQFVQKAGELRRSNTSDVAGILSRQRASAQAQLQNAEAALQQFRASTITQPTESGAGGAADVMASEFFRTQTELEAIRRDREALEQVAQQGRSGSLSTDAVSMIPSVTQTPTLAAAVKELSDKETELRALLQSFTDEYKPVQDLRATIQSMRTVTIPNLATDAANVLRQREAQFATQLRRDTARLRGIPQRTIEEARLRRDVTVAEELFKTVDSRYESARLSSVISIPDVRVLDPAQASMAATSNMKLVILAGGVFGALFLGIAIALMLDAFDHRFRYPEQVNDELGLDVIGAIPLVPKPKDIADNPESMLQSVEAFRGLRMHMHHAFDRPPVMLTITSPGAGDGKSMIASNLALSFAEAGFRTLLIDGDIRRGKLHAVFGIDRRPGLVDYLSGDAELPEVMREVSVNGRLTVIPSGTRRHRGPELLTSARLPALFNTIRSRYDVILVDSAPLGAGIDGYALGVATGNMALVMRTGVTDRRMAKAKVKLLERFPIRMMGVIVNDVPGAELYQEYSYLYGYGPDIDTDAGTEKAPMLRQTDVSHK